MFSWIVDKLDFIGSLIRLFHSYGCYRTWFVRGELSFCTTLSEVDRPVLVYEIVEAPMCNMCGSDRCNNEIM